MLYRKYKVFLLGRIKNIFIEAMNFEIIISRSYWQVN